MAKQPGEIFDDRGRGHPAGTMYPLGTPLPRDDMSTSYFRGKTMDRPGESRLESYLVRLWRDTCRSPWRVSVQNIRTRKVTHFTRPEELWAFFQAEMTGSEATRSGQMHQAD